MQRDLVTYPTWERYTILSHVVANYSIRDRRIIFQLSRNGKSAIDGNMFFPHYGITLSEFCVWSILYDKRRKLVKKDMTNARETGDIPLKT